MVNTYSTSTSKIMAWRSSGTNNAEMVDKLKRKLPLAARSFVRSLCIAHIASSSRTGQYGSVRTIAGSVDPPTQHAGTNFLFFLVNADVLPTSTGQLSQVNVSFNLIATRRRFGKLGDARPRTFTPLWLHLFTSKSAVTPPCIRRSEPACRYFSHNK